MNEKKPNRMGRPTKAPEGRRVTFHVSLSPSDLERLNAICWRPISPIEKSAMFSDMIAERYSKLKKDSN